MGVYRRHAIFLLLATAVMTPAGHSEILRVGVVQTVTEKTLDENRAKLLGFIGQAGAKGCHMVIFPEGALYWSDVATQTPTTGELDAAITRIGEEARTVGITVVFGVEYRRGDKGPFLNRGVVFGPQGRRLLFYEKNVEVPQAFHVRGVPTNMVICSDRWYLEHCDLPCLVQGSQVIIDISGGHGGDDGRPELRWIRYRPWAERTGAYVIISNPVHHDTDFMGHSPWGGGSAVIRPDGSIQASRTHEQDVLMVEDIDTDRATRTEARRRRDHPALRPFWDMGKQLLESRDVGPVVEIAPYRSAARNVTIAAAQIACSRDTAINVRRIKDYIRRGAASNADIVIFPELAVTGARSEDIVQAEQSELDDALHQIRQEADHSNVDVIVGMPCVVDGQRQNCAFVIGGDGSIKTRYAQLSVPRDDLFRPGTSTRAMWFELDGVHAIVTIGEDAKWVEIADLAASRGMILHFHITNETHPSDDARVLYKQRHLVLLMYAQFGAVVNAATAVEGLDENAAGGGISMIVSREGGHNKPAPQGIEYYLPYHTSIVQSAESDEAMLLATRATSMRNDMDLERHWRNRNRRSRPQHGWYEWMEEGARRIDSDIGDAILPNSRDIRKQGVVEPVEATVATFHRAYPNHLFSVTPSECR